MKKIALLFDIDDTLYDQVVPFAKALEQVFPHLAHISPEALFKARSHHGELSFRMSVNQEMSMEAMYRYRIQKPFEDFGVQVSNEEADAFQRAYEQWQKRLELSLVMEQLLDHCQERGVILGIISNGPGEHQKKKAETLGMGRWIPDQWTIVSGAVGILKPDVRIFRLTEERMGLDPQTMDIWYVGDSFANDIVGAAGAGWKTIWLNRRGKERPEGSVTPNITVGSDEELFAAVRELVSYETEM